MRLSWFLPATAGSAGLAIASKRGPSGVHQVFRTLQIGCRCPEVTGGQNVWGTSQRRRRFRRLGRSPAPSCETSESIFLDPRVGRCTAESVRNLTLRTAFRAGTAPCACRAGPAGPLTRRECLHAPPRRGSGTNRTQPPDPGWVCVAGPAERHTSLTAPDLRGLCALLFAAAPRAPRRPPFSCPESGAPSARHPGQPALRAAAVK